MSTSPKPSQEQPKSAVKPAQPGVLERTFMIIELLSHGPLTATEITHELDIAWATLHRTLNHLESRGYLARDRNSKQYSIGLDLWMVGSTYIASHRVVELATPELRHLGDQFPEAAVQVCERSSRNAIVIASYNAIATPITKATYGVHLPLHAGSKGHVLLAFAPEDFFEAYVSRPLEPLTSATITDPVQLRETMTEVRARGHASTIGDVQDHTGSIAVPVRDRNNVVASVSAVFPKSTMSDPTRTAAAVAACQRVSAAISGSLGRYPGGS